MTEGEAEAPILQPPDAKSQLTGKDPDAGKDRGQEKGATEDKMVGWHHQLNGLEFEQTPGDGQGQESLVWGSLQSHNESDMTEELNNNNSNVIHSCNCMAATVQILGDVKLKDNSIFKVISQMELST